MHDLKANNTFERAVEHRGRPVRAMDGVRGPGRNGQRWPAAQLDR